MVYDIIDYREVIGIDGVTSKTREVIGTRRNEGLARIAIEEAKNFVISRTDGKGMMDTDTGFEVSVFLPNGSLTTTRYAIEKRKCRYRRK